MDIEDTIQRKSYRDFDLVHLRHGTDLQTRWHISQQESGMNRNFGFAPSEKQARISVDDILKRRSEGRDTPSPR